MAVFPNALTGCWQGDSARTMTTLTAFDMVILLALALGLIVGFMRGFVQEILSLGALIAALFVLRYAHARARALGVNNITFRQANGEALDYAEGSFDLITTAMFWHESSATAMPRKLR